MKTGNPKESAGKDRMTFSLIIKALEPSIGHRINLVDSYIMGLRQNIQVLASYIWQTGETDLY